MPFRLVTETRSGPLEGPSFPRYTDALGVAMDAVRRGLTFPQVIYNGAGDVEIRIEPNPPVQPRRQFSVFQSGSVVTPGLSLMGGTHARRGLK